jgi:hypothetical protein
MKPSLGRIVHYRLSQDDIVLLAHLRARRAGEYGTLEAGEVFPMIIVRASGSEHPAFVDTVNGQVFLDGDDTYYVVNVKPGDGPGTWSWPVREVPSHPIGVAYGDRI